MAERAMKDTYILADHSYKDWPADLKPTEVALLFRVDPKTVTRWAIEGKMACKRTTGGHRRFSKEDVYRQYTGQEPPSIPAVRMGEEDVSI